MKNLTRIYNQMETRDGLLWYYRAHEFCKELSARFDLSLAVVCGIMSALSPGTNWERNKLETTNLIRGRKTGFTTYRRNVVKARAILNGELMPELAFSPRTGAKTYNFFHKSVVS